MSQHDEHDLGLRASVVFRLRTWLHRHWFAQRNKTRLWLVFYGQRVWKELNSQVVYWLSTGRPGLSRRVLLHKNAHPLLPTSTKLFRNWNLKHLTTHHTAQTLQLLIFVWLDPWRRLWDITDLQMMTKRRNWHMTGSGLNQTCSFSWRNKTCGPLD